MACNLNENSDKNSEKNVKLKQMLEEYKCKEGSLILILQKTQEIYGYLPMDVINEISLETGIKPAKIMSVATFYAQFRLEPVGKYQIMLCQGTACHVNGSAEILESLTEELGISEGETTKDELFTLTGVACLGCCSLSPVMTINGETYGNLTPDSAREIIKGLRRDNK